MRCPLLIVFSACCLSACQSAPPKPVQPFFVAGLADSIVQKHGGFRLDLPGRYPAQTHYASLASRAPQYGLLANPDPKQPAFAVQRLDTLLKVKQAVDAEFLRQLQTNAPALASQQRASAQAAWRFDVRRVAIFSKDVSNTHCEAMWFMRADLVDNAGQLLWSSGYSNNRLNDQVTYSCARIGTEPRHATQVLQAALNGAITDIISKVVSAP